MGVRLGRCEIVMNELDFGLRFPVRDESPSLVEEDLTVSGEWKDNVFCCKS